MSYLMIPYLKFLKHFVKESVGSFSIGELNPEMKQGAAIQKKAMRLAILPHPMTAWSTLSLMICKELPLDLCFS